MQLWAGERERETLDGPLPPQSQLESVRQDLGPLALRLLALSLDARGHHREQLAASLQQRPFTQTCLSWPSVATG